MRFISNTLPKSVNFGCLIFLVFLANAQHYVIQSQNVFNLTSHAVKTEPNKLFSSK